MDREITLSQSQGRALEMTEGVKKKKNQGDVDDRTVEPRTGSVVPSMGWRRDSFHLHFNSNYYGPWMVFGRAFPLSSEKQRRVQPTMARQGVQEWRSSNRHTRHDNNNDGDFERGRLRKSNKQEGERPLVPSRQETRSTGSRQLRLVLVLSAAD